MNKRILVVGTNNKHKAEEIAPILTASGLNLELRPASAYGNFDPIEDGATLDANAIIKAQAALKVSGEWSIADDTGLFVDALNGRPGIYAARYAGLGCTFADNISKLLRELEGIPLSQRGAQFSCVIALCRPGCEPTLFRGDCRGHISLSPNGTGGFGYDPIFVIDGLNKSFAQLTLDEKNNFSHRAIAVKSLRDALTKLLD
ncbi:MAG TPA: RdgB/HAM1 family non-canonical purine NTP pyrophosphatase [Planctomycetota bacterium]|nr:RdgB/HAM1 family non-canonical purine NTP pyrophosphatase [Planctomycetota bacterium]